MDNFEMRTFDDEISFDYSFRLLDDEAVSGSQTSQQSDYLRNVDLGLDDDDLALIRSDLCEEEIKEELNTPNDVLSEILSDSVVQTDSTGIQQQSPGTIIPSCSSSNIDLTGDCSFDGSDEMLTYEITDDVNGAVFHIPDSSESIGTLIKIPLSVLSVMPQNALMETDSELVFSADGTTGASFDGPILTNNGSRLVAPSLRSFTGSFTDDYLYTVSTKDFNRKIHELALSSEEIKKWKRKRRTLKNRGYAQNCRLKRVGRHLMADEEIGRLHQEIATLKRERDEERQKSKMLSHQLQQQSARSAAFEAAVANGGHLGILPDDNEKKY